MKQQVKTADWSKFTLNEDNPRYIRDKEFKKLVKSIEEFPVMLFLRPVVVNEEFEILGGNMRYRACIQAGINEIPYVMAKGLTKDQQREFIIKDNASAGEWDYEALANNWDETQLKNWINDFQVTFEPNLMPDTMRREVRDKDVEKTAEKMVDGEPNNQYLRGACCPSCGHEFYIEDK